MNLKQAPIVAGALILFLGVLYFAISSALVHEHTGEDTESAAVSAHYVADVVSASLACLSSSSMSGTSTFKFNGSSISTTVAGGTLQVSSTYSGRSFPVSVPAYSACEYPGQTVTAPNATGP